MFAVAACPPPSVRRRPGRRPVAAIPAERGRHIFAAGLMFRTDWPVKMIAGTLGVTRETVYQWTRLALTYDEPEADALRALAARSRRRLSVA